MLIQVGGQPRVASVQSEFWSRGLFCKVRSQRSYDNWGYIRLWPGHPWKRGKGEDIYATPYTFMKYIRPVALHVCRCIVTARLTPVFDDRELVIWPNPSAV